MLRAKLPLVAANTVPSGRFLNAFVTGARLSLRTMVNCWLGARFVSAVTFKVAPPSVGALLVIIESLVAPPPGRFGNRSHCTVARLVNRSVPIRRGFSASVESEAEPGEIVARFV